MCPFANGTLVLSLFGVDNNNMASADLTFSVKHYTSGFSLIQQTAGMIATLAYDNLAVAPVMGFYNFKISHFNRRARGNFNVTFSLTSRVMLKGERVILNLGGLAQDNMLNVNAMQCQIKDPVALQVSFLWEQIDISTLTAISLFVKDSLTQAGMSFMMLCYGVQVPYTFNP